jgi:hypothetical protein
VSHERGFMATQRLAVSHHASSVPSEIIEAGIVSGLVGGVAMGVVASVYSTIAGGGVLEPARAIAETVGASAGASGVLLGVVIHLVASMMFGILFAVATPRDVGPVPAFVFGEFAGIAILVIMNLVILPLMDPASRQHLIWGSVPGTIPVAFAFLLHLVYGAGLALAPFFRRRFSPA